MHAQEPMPIRERYAHTAVAVDTDLYILGGESAGDMLREFAVADISDPQVGGCTVFRSWAHVCVCLCLCTLVVVSVFLLWACFFVGRQSVPRLCAGAHVRGTG